jgi:hypothetical protein
LVYPEGKKIRFRGKVSTAGREKIHIIIPALYRKELEAKKLIGKIVECEMTEITDVD